MAASEKAGLSVRCRHDQSAGRLLRRCACSGAVPNPVQLAQFTQFTVQPMAQRTFGPQFFDEHGGSSEGLIVEYAPLKQLPPTPGNLLFGEQAGILEM